MDKTINFKGNILHIIALFFIATALLTSCKWTSNESEDTARKPIKSSKTYAERFGKPEETKTDYSDNIQQVEITQNDLKTEIPQTKIKPEIKNDTVLSVTKLNKLIIINSEVESGQTLGSILLPIKGVPYSVISKIIETSIPGVDFNLFNVGQKYQLVLNPQDSTLVTYTHSFSKENIIKVTLHPDLVIEKVLEMDGSKTVLNNPTNANLNSDTKKVKTNISDNNKITKSFLLGKTNLASSNVFVQLENQYHTKSKMFLEKETAISFKKMKSAAKKDGINLIIVSGARNYYSQKSIWERKFKNNQSKGLNPLENARKILRYSSMPSTSRHHWGTDIDINSLEPSYFESGRGKREYNWLVNNADRFGFCQVYTDFNNKDRVSGYQNEAWHWSYTPKANIYLNEYNKRINYSDINGFIGSELAKDLSMISDYVNGISGDCF
jgi:LAS superfamily LD-carboxypeptidase LdcB